MPTRTNAVSRLVLHYLAVACFSQASFGAAVLVGQAQSAQGGALGFGFHAGGARVPVSRGLMSSGPSQAEFPVLGASLDYRVSSRMVLEGIASFGFETGACADLCTRSGYVTEAAVLFSPAAPQSWGVAVGPTMGVAAFDGTQLGAGIRANLGRLRGSGPRAAAHFLQLTDGRHVAGVYASIRFGR